MNDIIREGNNQLILNECKKYNPKPCEMIDVERINQNSVFQNCDVCT